jgi:serine/threonine protein kinase
MINKRYIISKKIGEGRSKVFNVIDTEFPEREVAAKFLPVNSSFDEKQKFKEEYFTLQKLDHPNIIKAFELSSVILKDDEEDLEIDKFSPFITMEYFPSQELLNYYGLADEKSLYNIIKQICSVLYYLHQSNYIYYDLKAENILVADVNNLPVVKLIDLGFAHFIPDERADSIIGTPYYLAPELLKNEDHDHRVDFYSLGILLYRIVYGRFPFSSENEIDIYKANIEDEFIFSESKYSSQLLKVVGRLLKKNPVDRYQNALEIIVDLQITIDLDITKDFVSARVFSDRKDALNIISTYLKDASSNEVFTVNGFDGSGKSSLLQEVYHHTNNFVLVENTKTKSGIDSIKFILKKIIFTETIYLAKKNEFDLIAKELCDDTFETVINTAKRVLNTLQPGTSFLVLLDDFNLYDDYTKETLVQIIQILQVKGVKVILSESLDVDQASTALNNVCTIQLNQFTEHQLTEFIELSFSRVYPQDELKKIILLYSDLLPGSIRQFIKDLILLKVIRFNNAQVTFEANEQTILTLQSSHEELYRMRLSNLTTTELRLAQIISAFEISIEQTVLSALLDISNEKIRHSLNELEKKNIIESLNVSNAPKINSLNFKKYIYSTINNRTKFHLVHANAIKKLFPDFNSVELSWQYEAANDYEKSVDALQKEIDKAESSNSYSYKKILLEKALKFPIPEKKSTKLLVDLIQTLYKLSDYKSALENLHKLNLELLSEELKQEILFIKGSSLIETRNTQEGKEILTKLKKAEANSTLKENIYIQLAYAEFDLGNYMEAENLSQSELANSVLSYESQGRHYNLLSLIEFQVKGNIELALDFSFKAQKRFEMSNLPRRVAGNLINIGTLYDIFGKPNLAEEYWQKSLEINSLVGNLEQEASLLLNYGVFHHHNLNYEQAINSWTKAKIIFNSIGIRNLQAITIGNMGEVYYQMCDYENSHSCLKECIEMFNDLNNEQNILYFLYTIGKFFFTVGYLEELKQTINKFELSLISSSIKSEDDQLNLNSLHLLQSILTDETSNRKSEVEHFFEQFDVNENHKSHIDISFIYIEYLITLRDDKKALELLNLISINKVIEQNIILKAHQNYLFGKIAQQDQKLLEQPSIEYFEKAYSLLENVSITELTWKVLFEIACIYNDRGNFYKAKQPRIYAYELINSIGESISNNKIRNAYYNHPVRKQALEKLVQMGSQAQFNEYQKS